MAARGCKCALDSLDAARPSPTLPYTQSAPPSSRPTLPPPQTNTALSTGRRKRAIPEGTATPEAIGAFTLKGSFPLHKTTQPGILALALHPTEVSASGDARASARKTRLGPAKSTKQKSKLQREEKPP